MWAKNIQVYRIPKNWDMKHEKLEEVISKHLFQPCSSLETESYGWAPIRKTSPAVVQSAGKNLMVMFCAEKKLIPSSVVSEQVMKKAAEITEQQGHPPGRKQLKDIKQNVIDALIPRAFEVKKMTAAWFDLANGWLIIDASSSNKAEDVVKYLLKAIDKLPIQALRLKRSPVSAMTNWLSTDEAPRGFTVDQDTELKSNGEGGATVRYLKHTPENQDMQRQITTGKHCTRLALTWEDKISFVLTETFAIKKIAPLDVLKESEDLTGKNDDERFEADFLLMSSEIGKLLNDLVEELGELHEEERLAA
jgi:recombination associated protein RdgC